MTVLVIAEDLDPTADTVIELLTGRGVPVFRFDTAWFPRWLELDAVLDDYRWEGSLITEHRRVDLGDVRSVWYRQPTTFRFPKAMSAPERHHAAYEAKFGLGGVLSSLSALWVNHPARSADLHKPHQLAVAGRYGLAVPKTIVTNTATAVRRFADSIDGPLLIKPLSFASIAEEGVRKPIFAHQLTDDNLDDLAGVEATAHLFQQYIEKEFEVRLTVVGGRMFAASIHVGSDTARVDFRADYAALSYGVVKIPVHVREGVEVFMRYYRLHYGAFDFCVDHSGTWWMLECNPGGRYGFIEEHTGHPISAALADLLEKGHTRESNQHEFTRLAASGH